MVEATINQLSEFGKIAVFLILGTLFVMIAYGISYLLSKSKPSPGKLSTYECGEEPEGNSRIQFNNRFYVIALVFLLFDVEIVFLFPWSAVFAQEKIMETVPVWGWFSFIEMIVFVCVLLIGLVYVWMKGDLSWIRPRQLIPFADSKIPVDLYTAINAEKFAVQAFSPTTKKDVAAAVAPAASAPSPPPPKPVFKPRILKKGN
ncbi:NADH dehydrogenase subunit A [Anseongella ginsenosidimutans]|uniref:NADH-quinone oxidoreductase subunit A n=1 Tax=Anseongella ginsenosidimutans TaxID=496056 RepID=A0A4R3KTF6_9SPHI|nr:NADH-quinone oxidoreductase subunit A [Anseongella ginsenosidimutans]QEC53173.1 NADH-quinone oxidoreductase subunit A [Anseongella ginsenosidimutans]TCS87801.1 NADH dehydrogenase subunit A [Anseongella ginsenosidimutans]